MAKLVCHLVIGEIKTINKHYNHGFPNTFDYNHYVYSDYLVCSVHAIAHIIRY